VKEINSLRCGVFLGGKGFLMKKKKNLVSPNVPKEKMGVFGVGAKIQENTIFPGGRWRLWHRKLKRQGKAQAEVLKAPNWGYKS